MKSLITTLFLSVFIIGVSFGQKDKTAKVDSLKKAIKIHTEKGSEPNRLEATLDLSVAYHVDSVDNAIKILELEIKDFSIQIPDTLQGKVILRLASYYYQKYGDIRDIQGIRKAISTYEKGFPLFEKSENWYLKGVHHNGYSLVLKRDNRIEEALVQSKKSISYFEKNNVICKQWVAALGNLQGAYNRGGEYEKALHYARKAREVAKKIDDKKAIVSTAISIGEVLFVMEQYDFAMESFEEAVEIGKSIDFKIAVAVAAQYSAKCKMTSKNPQDWEIAKKQIDEAAIVFKELKFTYYASVGDESIGLYYERKKNYKEALRYRIKRLDYFISTEHLAGQGDAYIALGRCYGKLEQLDSARYYLNKSLKVNPKIGFIDLERSYRNLFELEERAGNYKEALEYHKKCASNRDSIFQKKIGDAIGKESVTQDVEGAEQAQKEAELEAKVLAGRNKLFIAIALGLLGILLIGGYLYQQLRKTRKQLESQNTQLTQLNDTKDRFFGIIAHDIRGPITSLDGVGEQMSYYLKKNNTERVNKLTAQIDNTSKKLTNLLDNLLNWALMQTGTIPYHPKSLDIHDVVQENIDLYTEVADMKNIQLTNKVANGTLAFADMSAITTVVRNLINNAVKFTPDGGEISISTAVEHDKVLIEINDTGTGVSAERLNKIFELNTERKKGTAGEKGSGLGLLLCKDLVELNKGTIRAISELGKGSTFIFSLPTS